MREMYDNVTYEESPEIKQEPDSQVNSDASKPSQTAEKQERIDNLWA